MNPCVRLESQIGDSRSPASGRSPKSGRSLASAARVPPPSWIRMDSYGFVWIPLNSYEFLRIPMDS